MSNLMLFLILCIMFFFFFFFQAEDGIRDDLVTGVQTCALPIFGELTTLEYRAVANESNEPWLRVRRECLTSSPDVGSFSRRRTPCEHAMHTQDRSPCPRSPRVSSPGVLPTAGRRKLTRGRGRHWPLP